MNNMNFFQLVQYYLEERQSNNIHANLKKDTDYLKASQLEDELCNQYENLDLTAEQRKVINEWIDSIHAQECAYTAVTFRMAMQYGFFVLLELTDLT
ncbi:MAG: hypothetical protein IJA10_04335 [Lachnospiraceae bacterium]|nr:hypothetical protein [Lachnospiraceae bacterium]